MFYTIKGLKYNFKNASNVIEIYLEIQVNFLENVRAEHLRGLSERVPKNLRRIY